MDQFDQAQEMDAHYRKQALSLQARVAGFAGVSKTTCIDCGEQIPEARRTFLPGCTRCVDCATDFEEREKRRRR